MKTPMLSAFAALSVIGISGFAGAQEPASPPAPPPTVEQQANPQGAGAPTDAVPTPETASDPVPPAMPADPNYHAGPYKGALTPPPPQELDKTYPPCTKTLQDNCRNRGAR